MKSKIYGLPTSIFLGKLHKKPKDFILVSNWTEFLISSIKIT